MTVQEISDEFTLLSHQGKAQAAVMHISGEVVKNITGIELIGDDIALIISEKTDPELKDKLLDLKANCDLAIEGRDIKIMELEKENAELKKRYKRLKERYDKVDIIGYDTLKNLTKAKEILKEFVQHYKNKTIYVENMQDLLEQSEQFIKDLEK